MPTPYGSRGGMAFSADELRVLRGALAAAVQPSSPATAPGAVPSPPSPERAAEVREYLRLAEAVDETIREGSRLRTFLLADLARYRDALPGSAAGYLDQLEDALRAGYLPRPDDLVALRALRTEAAGAAETDRRTALLQRCERLAEQAVRARLMVVPGGRTAGSTGAAEPARPATPMPAPASQVPQPARSRENDGGAGGDGEEPERQEPMREEPKRGEPRQDPPVRPSTPGTEPSRPGRPPRPVPTPGEVFPPRRRPSPPPEEALSA
ncbi:hypothetical protein [Streptomyces daliensis]